MLAGLAGLALAPAAPASAQLGVDEVVIAAGFRSQVPGAGWYFLTEVLGTGLASGAVTPPAGDPIALEVGGGGVQLEFEAGPFASFAALQLAHPAGAYTLTVNGAHTVTLGWAPSQPLGSSGEPSLVIDSPAPGATGVASMPDVAFSLDCSNCNDLSLELESSAVIFEFGELDVETFTNPIPFAAMTSSGSETELPDGPVDAELLAGLVDFSDESFDPPSALPAFTYIQAGVVFTVSTFTVPEPRGVAPPLAALATLGLLARRRIARAGSPVRARPVRARGREVAWRPRADSNGRPTV